VIPLININYGNLSQKLWQFLPAIEANAGVINGVKMFHVSCFMFH